MNDSGTARADDMEDKRGLQWSLYMFQYRPYSAMVWSNEVILGYGSRKSVHGHPAGYINIGCNRKKERISLVLSNDMSLAPHTSVSKQVCFGHQLILPSIALIAFGILVEINIWFRPLERT